MTVPDPFDHDLGHVQDDPGDLVRVQDRGPDQRIILALTIERIVPHRVIESIPLFLTMGIVVRVAIVVEETEVTVTNPILILENIN